MVEVTTRSRADRGNVHDYRVEIDAGGSDAHDPHLDNGPAGTVMSEDWAPHYEASTIWGDCWKKMHGAGPWPAAMQLRGSERQFIVVGHKICVPEGVAARVVHERHQKLGHCGLRKMVVDMESRFRVPNLYALVKKERAGCQLCQAMSRPNWAMSTAAGCRRRFHPGWECALRWTR